MECWYQLQPSMLSSSFQKTAWTPLTSRKAPATRTPMLLVSTGTPAVRQSTAVNCRAAVAAHTWCIAACPFPFHSLYPHNATTLTLTIIRGFPAQLQAKLLPRRAGMPGCQRHLSERLHGPQRQRQGRQGYLAQGACRRRRVHGRGVNRHLCTTPAENRAGRPRVCILCDMVRYQMAERDGYGPIPPAFCSFEGHV